MTVKTWIGIALTATTLAAADPVVYWNKVATDETAAAQMDPLRETRVLAMTHIAIHDAVNSIDRRFNPYVMEQQVYGGDAVAAVASAARHVLVRLLPARKASIEAAYVQALVGIPDSPSRQAGINAGMWAAKAILADRDYDGSERDAFFRDGTKPGEYRPTAPDFIPAFLPGWGDVKPFALKQASQFRPALPYKLDSAEYRADLREVKLIGQDSSEARTEEQSSIARYWYEDSGKGWNRIARNVAEPRNLNLWDSARLFASVNIAMADGFIGGFEAKYHHNFWRPITAIQQTESDWNAFIGTPPVPDFPSTHSVLGAAAAKVLARFFGTDFMSFDMTSGAPFPGLRRGFFSLSQAAQENAASRVLAGIHFPAACKAGMKQGEEIGDWVWFNTLRPVR